MLNEFPKKILQFLEKDLSFLKLDNYFWHVSQKAVDFLWKLNAELKKMKIKDLLVQNWMNIPNL